MQQAQERQAKMLDNLSKQRDMYKNMYHQLMKKDATFEDFSESDNEKEVKCSESYENNPSNHEDNNIKLKYINQQKKYAELEKKFVQVNNDFELYKKEKHTHEQILNTEIERLRNEAETNSNQCCQLKAKLDTVNERYNLLQSNIVSYKIQIKTLEDKCSTYNTTIGKL